MYILGVVNGIPLICIHIVLKAHLRTRYVDGTPTSEVTPGHYPVHPPTPPWSHKSISWSWMDDSHPFRSLSIGCPIPEIKLFSDSDLETPRSRSLVWSKGKVIQLAQYHINSLPFHQSDQQFCRYRYFEISPWNIQGQGHEGGQRSR